MKINPLVAVASTCIALTLPNICRADFNQRDLGIQDLIVNNGPSPPCDSTQMDQPLVFSVGNGTSLLWQPPILAPWGQPPCSNNISVHGSTLDFTFATLGLYTYGLNRDTEFIGFRIYDVGDAALGINSISIDPSTTLQGATVSLDGDFINVNLKGTDEFYVGNEVNPYTGALLYPPQVLILDASFEPTPEPRTMTLIGALLGARLIWWSISNVFRSVRTRAKTKCVCI